MTTWSQVRSEEPELATAVRAAFEVRRHATMATLRRDGSPRLSGTEVAFDDETGEVVLGSMPGARKALDLRRDPRVALHSPTVDTPEDDPTRWAEAKIDGSAVETTDPARSDEAHRFVLDVTQVVLTTVGAAGDHLLIRCWHHERGLTRHERR